MNVSLPLHPNKKEMAKLFAGKASFELAEKIAKVQGKELGNVILSNFKDGEFQPSYEETVRGQDVYIIQSTYAPSDHLMELLLMIDAAKRASAKKIVAVLPYFGYARQDRKDKPRVSIGAKLVANLLSAAGADRVITMDLHADQIQGFFEIPVDHLFASTVFIPHLKDLHLPNLTIATPDTGGAKRANAYAKHLNVDFAICYKQRKKANEVESMTVIGEVKGRDVVFVDDIIDTAGTIAKAAQTIMDQGANSVRALSTHAVLSGEAIKKIEASPLIEVIVTDTIPIREQSEKIKVLSVAALFSDVIDRVQNHESISSHFIMA